MTTTCLYKGCQEVVDDDVACHPHLLVLQLIFVGVPPVEAHRLAELDGQPVTITTAELLEDVDGGALGVETTTTTGDVFVVVPALFAHYRKGSRHA